MHQIHAGIRTRQRGTQSYNQKCTPVQLEHLLNIMWPTILQSNDKDPCRCCIILNIWSHFLMVLEFLKPYSSYGEPPKTDFVRVSCFQQVSSMTKTKTKILWIIFHLKLNIKKWEANIGDSILVLNQFIHVVPVCTCTCIVDSTMQRSGAANMNIHATCTCIKHRLLENASWSPVWLSRSLWLKIEIKFCACQTVFITLQSIDENEYGQTCHLKVFYFFEALLDHFEAQFS